MSWLILLAAICCEVSGTLTLKFTDGMTRLWPTVLMFAFYLCSLWGLNVAVVKIPVGTAYAVWSGLGTLIVALIGVVWLKEPVTLLRSLSALLIIAGVAGLYLSSSESSL